MLALLVVIVMALIHLITVMALSLAFSCGQRHHRFYPGPMPRVVHMPREPPDIF